MTTEVKKKITLELRPSDAEQRARAVLDGETNVVDSMEVLEFVYQLARERGVELEAVRPFDKMADGVTFSHEELGIALRRNIFILPTE